MMIKQGLWVARLIQQGFMMQVWFKKALSEVIMGSVIEFAMGRLFASQMEV